MYGQLLLSDTYNEAGNVVHSQSTTMSRFFKISININICHKNLVSDGRSVNY